MRGFFLAFPALVGLALAGCSSGPALIPVHGKLTFKGQPPKLPPKSSLIITLVPDTKAPEKVYPATVNAEEGTFEISSGVPAGKYRVAMLIMSGDRNAPSISEFHSKYNAQSTPLLIEVKNSDPISVDIPWSFAR